jgi:hypothetical protein
MEYMRVTGACRTGSQRKKWGRTETDRVQELGSIYMGETTIE